jgi:inhibitor of KinA
MMRRMRFAPLGDAALTVELGPAALDAAGLARARALAEALVENPIPGVQDVVPVYSTVTLYHGCDYEALCAEVTARAAGLGPGQTIGAHTVEIPVCYAPEFAPDLARVAAQAGCGMEEVVQRHSVADYHVGAVGFVPGFAYLLGLPASLHTPRLATPRTAVPAGSLGIGGAQTGIYPLASPGGWNLIGRTPQAMFRPQQAEPARLRMGDRVRFKPITREEFAAWK